jgi:exonuclease SbcC
MLPLKLTIQGFYSYQEPQVIDFASLTEAGLFGIFGAVGSGKSSILEAISFVLYGATERLDSGDRRAYNMLNLKSEKALIDFEFSTTQEEKYRFSATWKRRKKDYAATSTIERTACKWENGEWIPLESANAELVLGLKYDNFKRTVIIPQGKFKEFLELTKGDRVKMLKEIFNLYQYDFAEPTRQLTVKNNEALHHNAGVLSQYAIYSREALAEKETKLLEWQQQVQSARQEADVVQQQFEQLQRIKEVQEQLQQAQQQLTALQAQKDTYEQRAAHIRQYDKAVLHFKSVLEQKQVYQKNYTEAQNTMQQVQDQLQQAEQDWSKQQEVLEAVAKDYAQLDEWKRKAAAIQHIIDYRTVVQEYEVLQDRVQKGAAHVEQVTGQKSALQLQVQDAEQELATLKAQKPDTDILLQASAWFSRQEQLDNEQRHKQAQTEKLQQQVQEQEQYFVQWNIAPEDSVSFLDGKITDGQLALDHCTEQWRQIQVQSELQRYRTELTTGEPCPLCGSTTHQPEIHESEHTVSIEDISIQKKQYEQSLLQWREHRAEANRRLEILKDYRLQLRAENETWQQILDQVKAHRLAFNWEGLLIPEDRNTLQQYQQTIREAEQLITAREADVGRLRQSELGLNEQLQKYQQAVTQFQIQAQQLKGRMDVLEQQIPEDSVNWSAQSVAELKALETEYKELIITTEQRYIAETEKSQQLREQRASHSARLEQIRLQVSEWTAQLQQVNDMLEKALLEQGFADEQAVSALLRSDNIPQERADTEQFFRALHTAEVQLASRKEQLGTQVLDEEEYERVAEKRNQVQALLKERTDGLLLLENEVQQWTLKLEEKLHYEQQDTALQARALNLKTMTGLFQANGFVEYISEMYLQNLCSVANERFHRLTRNQLSLIYDTERGFEVMDYLNGGKTRSAKTLSGGQAFQASLCLALALADSIQSLNKFEKNFFFIDEGFGTLDKDAIDIVFQTLEQLYREHRVVGVISHVEELQERIPRYVQVIKDPERGSIVTLT